MLIRRALALSAIAVATAFAGDTFPSVSFRTPARIRETAGVAGHKPPPPQPEPKKETRVVTLREAIGMALQENIDIQWHKTDIKLQDAEIRLAWGDFDPALTLNSTYEFIQTPQNPTTITTADTAQQILNQQQALAEINNAVAAIPTPVPLPTAGKSPTPAPTATPKQPAFYLSGRGLPQ